jgi:hypothetical protein
MDERARRNRNSTEEGITMKELIIPKLGIEYFQISLSLVLKEFIESKLIYKNWEVIAIDIAHDTLVLKRYPDATPPI